MDSLVDMKFETNIAIDDSGFIQFKSYGHWDNGSFLYGLIDFIKLHYPHIPLWAVTQQDVIKTYEYVSEDDEECMVVDYTFYYDDNHHDGGTPVTIIDFWFPKD